MLAAVVASADIQKILKDNFVVVSCPHAKHNTVSFGVKVWVYSAEGKEISDHWWGTGNAMIGKKFTVKYHQQRVKEVADYLTKSLEKIKKSSEK